MLRKKKKKQKQKKLFYTMSRTNDLPSRLQIFSKVVSWWFLVEAGLRLTVAVWLVERGVQKKKN